MAGVMDVGLAGLVGWGLRMGWVGGLVGVVMGPVTVALGRRPERSAAVIGMSAPFAVLPPAGGGELIPYSINAIALRVARIRRPGRRSRP